jgi:unsaturated rhamnogalacturonyl hydrolase
MDGGVNPSTIFCSGNNTASATGNPSGTASRTASGTATGTNSPDSTGAASAVLAPRGVSKAGLGMLGMIVFSAIAGALL